MCGEVEHRVGEPVLDISLSTTSSGSTSSGSSSSGGGGSSGSGISIIIAVFSLECDLSSSLLECDLLACSWEYFW